MRFFQSAAVTRLHTILALTLALAAFTEPAQADQYIGSDSGLRHEDILHLISESEGSNIIVKCSGFSHQSCREYGLAGAKIIIASTGYSSLDIIQILQTVDLERVTVVSTGYDGFSLRSYAGLGAYLQIRVNGEVGAFEMKAAVRAAPVPSRVSVYVRSASITSQDVRELRQLGATVIL
jgi:hypothetical protein